MLHPFMPFVTEEIWDILPTVQGSVAKAVFPCKDKTLMAMRDPETENNINFIFGLISGIRNIRSEMNIQPSMSLNVKMESPDPSEKTCIEQNSAMIKNLANLGNIDCLDKEEIDSFHEKNASASSATAVVNSTTIHVSLEGVIDFEKEENRLTREIEKITKELLSVSKRLNNESFLDKAPEAVVTKVKNQQEMLEIKNDKLKDNLNRIRGMKK